MGSAVAGASGGSSTCDGSADGGGGASSAVVQAAGHRAGVVEVGAAAELERLRVGDLIQQVGVTGDVFYSQFRF